MARDEALFCGENTDLCLTLAELLTHASNGDLLLPWARKHMQQGDLVPRIG